MCDCESNCISFQHPYYFFQSDDDYNDDSSSIMSDTTELDYDFEDVFVDRIESDID